MLNHCKNLSVCHDKVLLMYTRVSWACCGFVVFTLGSNFLEHRGRRENHVLALKESLFFGPASSMAKPEYNRVRKYTPASE